MISRLLALLFVLVLGTCGMFIAMIYGWGVHPQRVWVIILMSVFYQAIVAQLYRKVVEGEDQ